MGGFGGNDLSNACGTIAKAACQELEVGELVMNCLGELDAALVVETKGFLEVGEHARSSWDGESHTAEFPQELVPFFGGNTAAAAEEIEQLMDAVESVWR